MPFPDLHRPMRAATTRNTIAVALALACFNGAMPAIAAESLRREPPPLTEAQFRHREAEVLRQIRELSMYVDAIGPDGTLYLKNVTPAPESCGPTHPITSFGPGASGPQPEIRVDRSTRAAVADQLSITAIQQFMLLHGHQILQIEC